MQPEYSTTDLNLVEKLKNALEESRERIQKLEELIAKVHASPLSYAVVVQTGHVRELPGEEAPALKAGDKAKIREELLDGYKLKVPFCKILTATEGQAVISTPDGRKLQVPMEALLSAEETAKKQIETLTLLAGGALVELQKPDGLEVKAGQTVLFHPQAGGIICVAPFERFGHTAVISEIMPYGLFMVEIGGEKKLVYAREGIEEIEKGDRVILDHDGVLILRNLKQQTTEFTVEHEINVSLEEIGGLEDAKEAIHEMVVAPRRHPDIFKAYGKHPSKGVLFFGEPGNGKTMLAKAVATLIAKMNNSNLTDAGFIYVKGPEVLDPYVGVAEQKIRGIFERARRYKVKTGLTATIFIDEAEALLSQRGTGVSSDMEKTIVPTFLSEMDGLDESSAFIILATNRADKLDPAVHREGRIDKKLMIPPPTEAATMQIIQICLAKTPLSAPREEISKFLLEQIFSTSISDKLSGAKVVAVVQESIAQAIKRDIAAGELSGLSIADCEAAIFSMAKREKKALKTEHQVS